MPELSVERFRTLAVRSRRVIAVTGAGVSTPSGVPDFLTMDDWWDEEIPRELALDVSFFHSHPAEFWRLYKKLFLTKTSEKLVPSAAHHFLAELEADVEVTVLTQNVDGLHGAAGSSDVRELHGNAKFMDCVDCRKRFDVWSVLDEIIPMCACGGRLKPSVVLYGEDGNYHLMRGVFDSPGLLLMMGTSLMVAPVAYLPHNAASMMPHLTRVYWDRRATEEYIPLFHHVVTTDFKDLQS